MASQKRKSAFWVGLGLALVMVGSFSFWLGGLNSLTKSTATAPDVNVSESIAPQAGVQQPSAGVVSPSPSPQNQPLLAVSPTRALIPAQDNPLRGRNTWQTRFAKAEFLSEELWEQDGELVRSVLLKSDFKYPMIRVKEVWTKPPNSQTVSQEYMVADHLLFQPPPQVTFAQFKARALELGALDVIQQPTSNVYRVQFEVGRLDEFLAAVKKEWPTATADPDYIRFVR